MRFRIVGSTLLRDNQPSTSGDVTIALNLWFVADDSSICSFPTDQSISYL